MSKKGTFRDKNIEEICPFPQLRRGMFYLKNDTFYLEKKRHFFGVEILGEQAPWPSDLFVPSLFYCAPSGAKISI